MNGFLVFFAIIGIIACLFAITVVAIYAGSFVLVAIKSFKANVKAQTEVQKEHIDACADSRKARLQRKREVTLAHKDEKAEKELEMKKKKILLENKRKEIKEKKAQAKLDKANAKIDAKTAEPTVEEKAEEAAVEPAKEEVKEKVVIKEVIKYVEVPVEKVQETKAADEVVPATEEVKEAAETENKDAE